MADSDPNSFFRPKWHEPYWRRPRLFQLNGASAFTPVFRRQRIPPDRFLISPDPGRRRKFSPLGILYTGNVSLLWGV